MRRRMSIEYKTCFVIVSVGMRVLYDIFPDQIKAIFNHLPFDDIYEFRLRANCPVIVCYSGRNLYLTQSGLTREPEGAIMVSRTDLDSIIHKASNYSIYAINDQIREGYITIQGGIRMGIAGTVVMDGDKVSTVKNVQSLNIRIPHDVRGCSYGILNYIFDKNNPFSTLIVAPPGAGKTTFLRDLAWQICDKYPLKNVLVLDERGEIAANQLGDNQLDVGETTDVITGCSKMYGFSNGIRSLRPDVIITDEVATSDDIEMIRIATRSGVCVIASVHAGNIDEIRQKPYFSELVREGVFDRYVVLGIRDTAGCVCGVYDRNLKLMAM